MRFLRKITIGTILLFYITINTQCKKVSSSIVWRLNPYVQFVARGVYFKLTSEYEIWRYRSEQDIYNGQSISTNISGMGLTIEMYIKGPQAWWKKRPCDQGDINTIPSGFHFSEYAYGKFSKTLYLGTRNLNGFYLFVQGRVKYNDGSFSPSTVYGGRNINSPY